MRISDWSSDVCSSDLLNLKGADINVLIQTVSEITGRSFIVDPRVDGKVTVVSARPMSPEQVWDTFESVLRVSGFAVVPAGGMYKRSEEHTSELQSLMRISYAVFCLQKKIYHSQRIEAI